MSVDVKLDLKHLESFVKECEKAKKLHLKVGVLAGATYDPPPGKKKGTPVSEVAKYLEYGWTQTVKPQQSKWFMAQGIYNIRAGTTLSCPPRPTFQATSNAKSSEWLQIGASYLRGLKDNPLNAFARALEAMGTAAVQDLQETITTGGVEGQMFEQRHPLTMMLYGMQADNGKHRISGSNQTTTTKPLYRTGKFASSIAFEITD